MFLIVILCIYELRKCLGYEFSFSFNFSLCGTIIIIIIIFSLRHLFYVFVILLRLEKGGQG